MKKSIVWMLLAVLSVCGTSSFAQWRSVAQAAQNAAKRQNFVSRRVTSATRQRVPPMRVAERMGLKDMKYVTVKPPLLPTAGNKVNASYLYKYEHIKRLTEQQGLSVPDSEIQEMMARRWIVGPEDGPGVGNAFYEDQSALARDLNEFYEGSGIEVEVGGQLAKLYALPVDGILYKPAGYTEPVVLTAESDFVVYYPKTKTGQIVENTPQMRDFLSSRPGKSSGFDEVVSLGGREFHMPSGEPDFNFIDGVKPELDVHAIKQEATGDFEMIDFIEVDSRPAGFVGAMLRADHKMYMDQSRQAKKFDAYWNRKFGVTHYTSQNQLARDMAAFYEDFPGAPQVYNRFSRQNFYVFELPVEGLEYAPEGSPKVHVLDPKTEVVLYHEQLGGQIVERANLENKMFFEDVDDLEGIK